MEAEVAECEAELKKKIKESESAEAKAAAIVESVYQNDGCGNARFASTLYTKNDHFAQTGSGQT